MTVRKWLTTAALSAGLGLGLVVPAGAADPKAEFTFGTLRATAPEAAKAQAEAWLKKAGKFDAAAFELVDFAHRLAVRTAHLHMFPNLRDLDPGTISFTGRCRRV